MDPNTRANLPHLAGRDLWQTEGFVNGIWNGILNFAYEIMTLNDETFVIAPELVRGGFKADLAVIMVGEQETFKQPSMCYEGKGGSNSETLNKAIEQIQGWTTSAKIGTYGSIWGLAAKAEEYQFIALDRRRDNDWRAVALPTQAGGDPTFSKQANPNKVTDANTLPQLGWMFDYIRRNPLPQIPYGS